MRFACVLALLLAATSAAEASDRAQTWRFDTVHGIVRVLIPAGFDAATATTVVYLHGYHVDVDRVWQKHELRRAFEDTGLNAMWIVCEAPEDAAEPVSWRSLRGLLSAVERNVELDVPRGRVVAVAHGGGARAVRPWLRASELSTVVLVDAAHANTAPHYRWSRARDRRLIEIAHHNHWRSHIVHRLLPGAAVIDDVGAGRAMLAARRVYVRADEIVVRDALRVVLRALPGPRLNEPAHVAEGPT